MPKTDTAPAARPMQAVRAPSSFSALVGRWTHAAADRLLPMRAIRRPFDQEWVCWSVW